MFLTSSHQLDPPTTKSEALIASHTLQRELGRNLVEDPILQKAVHIVKQFTRDNGGILYGGEAINALLPAEAKFYDAETQFPDLDIYFTQAKKQTERLAQLLHKSKVPYVKAKAGVHHGTYKISVDFHPIADLTELPKDVYDKLKTEAITVDGIFVASPDWLRMGLYKELMTPLNQPSRWPKIAPRLALLNRYRPFQVPNDCGRCRHVGEGYLFDDKDNPKEFCNIMNAVAEYVSTHKLVLFGATALNSFIRYSKQYRFFHGDKYPMLVKGSKSVSDFDVFTPNLNQDSKGLVRAIHKDARIAKNRITTRQVDGIDDLIPKRHAIRVDDEVIIELYEDNQCRGYLDGAIETDSGTVYNVRIASLPTMIGMWFTWLYTEPDLEEQHAKRCKLFCAIEFLLNHQSQFAGNPLSIFSLQCGGGKPATLRDKLRTIDDHGGRWSWSHT